VGGAELRGGDTSTDVKAIGQTGDSVRLTLVEDIHVATGTANLGGVAGSKGVVAMGLTAERTGELRHEPRVTTGQSPRAQAADSHVIERQELATIVGAKVTGTCVEVFACTALVIFVTVACVPVPVTADNKAEG